MPSGIDNLKHIVVLMMENRSFDHMLGFSKAGRLTGSESNLDSTGGIAQVSNDASYVGDLTPDPGHSLFSTLTQLYGEANIPVSQQPSMSGFVRSYEAQTGDPHAAHRIMKCFAPERLPVLTTLAQQFCVCDHWFSSVPGPSFPNRAFVHAATSMGRVDMGIDWRKLPTTIYERLAENKLDSVIYYHDSTLAATFDRLAGKPNFFGSFDNDFLAACAENDLPPYSFIEPRFANSVGGDGQPAFSASDQHPGHDVKEGEALIQTVFEAVWNNDKVRNSTLLVVLYSCHGGLYDHVPPPATVNPDGKVLTNESTSLEPSFDFTRLGVRVPAVLISPYIPPRTIDNRIYDHTSIIATALRLFNAREPLTLRDRNANSFEHNLVLERPRTDRIDLGLNTRSQPPTEAQLAQPISEYLLKQVLQAAMLEERLPQDKQTGIDPTAIKTEAQAADYLQRVNGQIHGRTPDPTGKKSPRLTASVTGHSNLSATPTTNSGPTTGRSGVYPTPKVAPDSWSHVDTLGYRAYARTLAAVITHPETVPPLAIGIKASWGAGKTSLMKQVQHLLDGDAVMTEENRSAARIGRLPGQLTVKELLKTLDTEISIKPLMPKPTEEGPLYGISPRVTVWFNAWKYQTSEQIWAGLAHSIISQVTARMDPRSSELFWLSLYSRRVNKDAVRRKVYELALRDLIPLALKCLFGAVVVVSAIAAVSLVPSLAIAIGPKLVWAKIAAPILSLIPLVWKWNSKLGEKAADAYKELVREPDYEGKMGFLYLVESDIRAVLELVATDKSPLVIFIDDLDRCVPHRVAEVVEAINLSLSGDYPNCIFVLGMEPALVAAALEVANKDVIERLSKISSIDSSDSLGWRFMEKIIQLPVIVPKPTEAGLGRYLSSLLASTGPNNPGPQGAAHSNAQPDPEETRRWKERIGSAATLDDVENVAEESLKSASPEERANIAEASKQVFAEKFTDRDPSVARLIQSVASLVGGNPRQIKRYINVFRFYVTLRYNLWVDSGAEGIWLELPSPEALAKFIVLITQWPQGADFLRIVRETTDLDKNARSTSLLLLLEEKSRSLKGEGVKADTEWLKFLESEALLIGDWVGKRSFREFLARGESLAAVEQCGLW
jgi:hypothetical protein